MIGLCLNCHVKLFVPSPAFLPTRCTRGVHKYPVVSHIYLSGMLVPNLKLSLHISMNALVLQTITAFTSRFSLTLLNTTQSLHICQTVLRTFVGG